MTQPFRPSIPFDRLLRALQDANNPRTSGAAAVATVLQILLETQHHLVVYGSLVPGGSNHDKLDGLSGTWHAGEVTGTLHEHGWGAAIGYPALEWTPDGARVPAQLFVSRDLPAHWDRLDRFEGTEYRRILVPFLDAHGVRAVGNLYERSREP